MTVYRPAPEVPRLPLPRRHVERLAAIVTWAAWGVVLVPHVVNQLVAPEAFARAPTSVGLVALASFVAACTCAGTAAPAVKGLPSEVRNLACAVVPVLLVAMVISWLGVAFADLELDERPHGLAGRPLAEQAIAVLDLPQAFAFVVVAVASAFAALVLLAAATTVDETRDPAPADRRPGPWLALAAGLATLAVAHHRGAPAALSVVAAAVLVSVSFLARRVARRAPFVARHAAEEEAAAWGDGVIGAAALAGTSLALLGHASALYVEGHGLAYGGALHVAAGARGAVAAELLARVWALRASGLVAALFVALPTALATRPVPRRRGLVTGTTLTLLAFAAWVAFVDRGVAQIFVEHAADADRAVRAP